MNSRAQLAFSQRYREVDEIRLSSIDIYSLHLQSLFALPILIISENRCFQSRISFLPIFIMLIHSLELFDWLTGFLRLWRKFNFSFFLPMFCSSLRAPALTMCEIIDRRLLNVETLSPSAHGSTTTLDDHGLLVREWNVCIALSVLCCALNKRMNEMARGTKASNAKRNYEFLHHVSINSSKLVLAVEFNQFSEFSREFSLSFDRASFMHSLTFEA